jgi:PIN domain nuclease of toxin-antitoxin system
MKFMLDTHVPIAPSDAASFHRLPRLKHKDPFDRLMIWQAIQQNFVLITKDREMDNYLQFGLQTIW